jgi:hypothetical protein
MAHSSRLLQFYFQLMRVNLSEELPILHILAFLLVGLGQIAAQLRQYGHGGDRR